MPIPTFSPSNKLLYEKSTSNDVECAYMGVRKELSDFIPSDVQGKTIRFYHEIRDLEILGYFLSHYAQFCADT